MKKFFDFWQSLFLVTRQLSIILLSSVLNVIVLQILLRLSFYFLTFCPQNLGVIFFFILSALSLWKLFEQYIVFSQVRGNFANYSNANFASFSLLSFWDSNYTYIGPFYIVPHWTEAQIICFNLLFIFIYFFRLDKYYCSLNTIDLYLSWPLSDFFFHFRYFTFAIEFNFIYLYFKILCWNFPIVYWLWPFLNSLKLFIIAFLKSLFAYSNIWIILGSVYLAWFFFWLWVTFLHV